MTISHLVVRDDKSFWKGRSQNPSISMLAVMPHSSGTPLNGRRRWASPNDAFVVREQYGTIKFVPRAADQRHPQTYPKKWYMKLWKWDVIPVPLKEKWAQNLHNLAKSQKKEQRFNERFLHHTEAHGPLQSTPRRDASRQFRKAQSHPCCMAHKLVNTQQGPSKGMGQDSRGGFGWDDKTKVIPWIKPCWRTSETNQKACHN